ncbi:hypothetical protein HH310_39790 [Actinoplanes sp. TBRC 11911]|uniref:hypothetical protein n=1 Tax=Actinoplanes sp. TBRC 11911 TaxID=2729386 RepID=UPI00145C958C|nr:hypothetical protein [Actinoplanes sp. TBRC 11911]NMO57303.1 hypothetical protein [Actinoplanes sp. TBRC 11911]
MWRTSAQPGWDAFGAANFVLKTPRRCGRPAAATAADNPDEFLHRIVARRAEELIAWSLRCDCIDLFQGSIASAVGQGGSLLLVVYRLDLQRPR